eukprot:CAMPEP_0202730940 /NCGR_PEP_ID=MMETSP1385-20130828/186890_1 /ASSEMBLY_ACC=CAM_ASM_000861 /TAXON_ID=933848 /ORGANISM="Elphidium margaritaceum" /LENGTH=513 /DNA_ID=CAMNT_0049397221 /DNA_START=1538 /DNA_END=3079 /DNA_ORIENTATION=-
MSEDPFGALSDDWFTSAGEADKWKGRFACCNEAWDIVEKLSDDVQIKGSKKCEKAINFFIQWLEVEAHVFTRMKLLQILSKVLAGMPTSVYEKKAPKLAEALMKQWVEKKVFDLVSPNLITLWKQSGDFSKWTSAISTTLESKNPVVKMAFWQFLSDAAEQDPARARDEWKKLLKGSEILENAMADTDNRNNDTKHHAYRFIATVAIFMGKDKDKRYTKKIGELCEDEKKKKVIETEKETMRATMKENAIALKKAKRDAAGGGGGDDAKENDAVPAAKAHAAASLPNTVVQHAAAGGAAGGTLVTVSNEQVDALRAQLSSLQAIVDALNTKFESFYEFMEDEKKSRQNRRLITGTGASIHDLFENFLLSTIGMPHYLQRFKAAGANDIRMVEHFDVPFLKETIGVQNKLEGKLLVKFIGKFNEETMQFREWLKQQNVMRAYVNTFESKGIITWGILSDYCENVEAVQDAFRIKNKAHAHFLFTQLERYRNGELSDAAEVDSDASDESDSDDDE